MSEILNEVEVFIPAAPDQAYSESFTDYQNFMKVVEELSSDGILVKVYERGRDDWAFAACDPVAEILEINGDMALPITLIAPEIFGMYAYPDAAKLRRLAKTPLSTPKDAGNACLPSGTKTPLSTPKDAGNACLPSGKSTGDSDEASVPPAVRAGSPVASLFRFEEPKPAPPEIGGRFNLLKGEAGSS